MKGVFSCFTESAKEFTKLRSLTITALFIAVSMMIESFSIDLQFVKLNFAFWQLQLLACCLDPAWGWLLGLHVIL